MPARLCHLFRLAPLVLGLTIALAGGQAARAQSAALTGFVTDAASGQALELVNVALLTRDGDLRNGAVTSRDGLYALPGVAPGAYVLRVSYIGYETVRDTLRLRPGERLQRNVQLRPGGGGLDEVLVETERTGGAARVTAGQQTVRPADIELVPTPDLSGDLASLLTTLPGVVAIGDQGGQLFIRGGEPSQNLVQIDGVLLYQPFHILGFYSAFPSDILNQTDIYAGGFPSKFGERISSVLDVTTRSGNLRRVAGTVTASPFVSAALLEGPLVRDRVSLLVSVRQSLVEDVAARIVGTDLPFRFGDAFAKLHAVPTSNVRLSAIGLRTYDRGTLGQEVGGAAPDEVRWTNDALGLRALIVPRISPVMADLRASFSRLNSELGPTAAPSRTSAIGNLLIGGDVTFFGRTTDVDVGFTTRIIWLESRLGGLYQNLDVRDERLVHVGAYVEPTITVTPHLELRAGLRAQFYEVRFNPFLEPRLRLIWSRGVHQLSAAYGIYHQAILGLNDRRDAASVFSAWTSAPRPTSETMDDDVRVGRPQRARHVLAGYRVSPFAWLDLSVEGFHKELSNLFVGEWTAYPRFTTRLQTATGRTYGFDVRAEVRLAATYGYVTYGYSNTRYEGEQPTLALWFGEETLAYRPPHDRRHQVNALLSSQVAGFRWSLRWAYGAGLPFSQAVGFDGFALVDDVFPISDIPGARRVIYERPYNAVLPAYHRLDASVERAFSLGAADLTVQGSVINVYDRRNIFYLDVFTLRRIDQLPIIPSLGLKLAF